MNVLVLGSRGQLGHELMHAAWPAAARLIGLARPQIDVTDATSVAAALAAQAPDLVVNATAYTAVDRAESEPEAAFAANRDGPAHLAAACARGGVPLIHVSTDYVFDGTKPAPYDEDDPIGPLGVYGASKAAGEAAVRAAWPRHIILRTSWVYGSHGRNFVKTMLRLAGERDSIAVVADQHGAPTAAADLAAAITAIAARLAATADIPWGTYHFAAAGATTWHGIAEHIFTRLQAATGRCPGLRAITSGKYPGPARRPTNSRFDCRRITATFGIATPDWRDSLDRVLDHLLVSSASDPSPPRQAQGL